MIKTNNNKETAYSLNNQQSHMIKKEFTKSKSKFNRTVEYKM